MSLLFIHQLVVFHFDDHVAVPLHRHQESEETEIPLWSSCAGVLICWSLPRWQPSHPPVYPPGCSFPFSFGSISGWWAISEQSISQMYHSVGPHSPIGTSLGEWVSDLGMGTIGNWAMSSIWKGTEPFATASWSQRNWDRYHFHCHAFPLWLSLGRTPLSNRSSLSLELVPLWP